MDIRYRTELPDKRDYFALFASTGWNAAGRWNADHLHEAAKNSWRIVTAFSGGNLVASGRIVSDGFVQCLICEMMVLPEYQGKGIGSEILNRLLEQCRLNGIPWVQLACARGKKGFYERFGFRERPADAPGMSLFL